jgi:hypothetical protein
VNAPTAQPVTKRLLTLLALAAAAFSVALATPAPADAAKPCWKVLLNDWFDGRIDKTYPVSCYRAAIRNLPEDVESYSNAREEIERALLAAIKKGAEEGNPLGPGDLVPPQTGVTTDSIGRTSTGPDGTETDAEAVPGAPDDEGPLGGVLKPANADSVPIPLLVLAGLALVLLAAASAGYVARRLQARRAGGAGLPRGPESP